MNLHLVSVLSSTLAKAKRFLWISERQVTLVQFPNKK